MKKECPIFPFRYIPTFIPKRMKKHKNIND